MTGKDDSGELVPLFLHFKNDQFLKVTDGADILGPILVVSLCYAWWGPC